MKRKPSPDFLTPSQFGKAVGVSRATVLRWIRAGQLPAARVGRTIRVPRDALERVLERQHARTKPSPSR